jgi:glycosyltransferase involved in cell wall biosynthesis
MKRIPFVFELRDIWPESIRAVGAMKNSAVLDWLEKLELFLYRKAALVVSVTHSFREDLARRGIDPRKVAVVTNGIDTRRFRPRPRDEALAERLGLGGKFVAGYVGTHGMAHRLETILDAAALLKAQPDGDRFRFLLLGDGASKAGLVAAANARGLDNVVFVDTVPKEEVAGYWALLDASIIHLKRSDLFRSVIPSKLFECMGMSIPVLHGVEGESAAIVEREGVGLLFQPENAEDLCRRLRELADDAQMRKRLGANGIEAARHYDRKALAMKMLAQLEAIVAGKPLPHCRDESETPAEYQFNR